MDSGERVLIEKGKSKTHRKRKASALKQESLAEFFQENKKIAGFDNPGKALYNTVRGLVENALDSAESFRKRPSVEITIEEIDRSELNSVIGIGVGSSYYRVTCKDNGRGMAENDILELIGPVVYRKKREVKQTRGRSGLGVKMALIWSKMSTGVPVEISTSMVNQDYTSNFSLDIEINRNIPRVELALDGVVDDSEERIWHGTEIKVEIEGEYGVCKWEIMEYLKQMVFITPYAQFDFRFAACTQDGEKLEEYFELGTLILPAAALKREHHPLAKDVELLLEHVADEGSKDENLLQLFQLVFPAIGITHAKRLIGEIPQITWETKVVSLTAPQLLRVHRLLAEFDSRLIPLGEENLRMGTIVHVQPDHVATYTTSGCQGGCGFIVETGVSLGGEDVKQGLNIFRFANRVPLLFEEDADVVTTTTKSFDWKHYRINPEKHKIGVYVSIVSTKIPFKIGTGMECIGDDMTEIAHAVKICLEKCCMKLKEGVTYNLNSAAKSMYSILTNLSELYPDRLIIQNWENLTPELRELAPNGVITEEYLRETFYQQNFQQVVVREEVV